MMTHEQREQFVRDLLTMSGVEEQSVERSVYCALHDALMAAVYFELLGGEEKDFVSKMLKKAQFFFSSKMSLKEKKQSKKKKSTFPPDPQSDKKEKTKKEKETPSLVADAEAEVHKGTGTLCTLEERREAFRQELQALRGQYSNVVLSSFYSHWAEEEVKSGKMLFELQKTWNTNLRLLKWSNNQFALYDELASDRKQRQSKKQAQKEALDTAKVEADKRAAQMREEQDRQREEQMKQAKAGKMTPEEFAQLHPDSLMARMYKEVKSEK